MTLSSRTYNSENFSQKTYTVVQKQELQDIEKFDSKEEMSRLKWIIHNARKKVCVHFQTDTNKLNFVVYRYRDSFHLKYNEIDLKMTED